MPYDYRQIIIAQGERIDAEAAATAAQLESARVCEDADAVHACAQRLLELDAQRQALHQRANTFVAQQQHQQAHQNKFGLTPAEVEVAHNSFGAIKDARSGRMVDLSPEQKEAEYAKNRHKYRTMLANGTYSNDQGSVRR